MANRRILAAFLCIAVVTSQPGQPDTSEDNEMVSVDWCSATRYCDDGYHCCNSLSCCSADRLCCGGGFYCCPNRTALSSSLAPLGAVMSLPSRRLDDYE